MVESNFKVVIGIVKFLCVGKGFFVIKEILRIYRMCRYEKLGGGDVFVILNIVI